MRHYDRLIIDISKLDLTTRGNILLAFNSLDINKIEEISYDELRIEIDKQIDIDIKELINKLEEEDNDFKLWNR